MTTAGLSRPAASLWPLARRCYAWWTAELAAMAPPRLLGLLAPSEQSGPVLEIGRDDTTLLLPPRGGSAPSRLPLGQDDPAALRARVRAALRHHRSGGAATIRLDPSLVLETTLSLPVQAEGRLQPILAHQIEQLVPLPAHEVAFAWRIGPRVPGARTMTVHLAIVTRAAMDRALVVARDVGLVPRRIVTQEAAAPALVLWRANRGQALSGRQRAILRGLEAATVVALVAAFGMYVHRLDTVRTTLREDLAAATRLAGATRELGRQVTRSQEALALLDARLARPAPLRVLDELTGLVASPAWISQLRLRGDTVEITGVAPRATDLIARIEASSLFERPQFRAPITLSPDGRGERFDLSFGIRSPK